METAYEEKLAEKYHGLFLDSLAKAREEGKKELNYFLPYDFTEIAATFLKDLLEKDGYQVVVKAMPTRIGRAYIVHVKIQ